MGQMALWVRKLFLGFALQLAGAAAVAVDYPAAVCAVKGSTVTLPCSFIPLPSVQESGRQVAIEIVRVRWCQNHLICQGNTPSVYDSRENNNNNPRYKYLGDKKSNCTLQITDVQPRDEATLRFRMEANHVDGHFTGQSGVSVSVADGAVTINSSRGDGRLTGGDSVTLRCSAPCSFHQLNVTWFKNNHALPETGPALQLGPLTTLDSGNYTCRLRTSDAPLSVPYHLQVEETLSGMSAEDGGPALVVGVTFGVLLVLFTLIMVLCIVKRGRSAKEDTAGSHLEHEHDNIYSNVPAATEPDGGGRAQQACQDTEDVSYASVQFNQASRPRPTLDTEDAIVYSSVVSRG